MKFIISGKNLDVTDGLKAAIEEKIGKLERYFTPETEVHVTLSVEKERQKIEITIPMKGNIVRAEQVSDGCRNAHLYQHTFPLSWIIPSDCRPIR